MKKLLLRLGISLCCVGALCGCNDSESDSGPDTPPDHTPDFTFELTGKSSGSITVHITPKNGTGNFYWAPIEESTLNDKYGSDPAAAAATAVMMLKTQYADYGYDSFEEFYASQISTGAETMTFDGYDAQTPLYCIAFGLDETGTITTDVNLSERYVTDAVLPSANTFRITMTDKTTVRVEPSNEDTYTFYIFPKSTVDAYESLDKLAAAFVEQNKNSMHLLTFSGPREKDFYDVFATYGAGTYIAFAFGYESGCITTGVTAESYEYEVADPMVGEPFSNLTGDVSVTCTEAYFEPALEGNAFTDQALTYFLALRAEDSFGLMETRLGLYIQKRPDAPFPGSMAGTYRIDGSLAPDTVVKGWKDADGWYHGSIYYEMGAYVPNASINSGSVTIVDNADGTYRVTVEAQEMNGHAIRADFTGRITQYEE